MEGILIICGLFFIPLTAVLMYVLGIIGPTQKKAPAISKKPGPPQGTYTREMFIADALNPELSVEDLMERVRLLPPRKKKEADPIMMTVPYPMAPSVFYPFPPSSGTLPSSNIGWWTVSTDDDSVKVTNTSGDPRYIKVTMTSASYPPSGGFSYTISG